MTDAILQAINAYRHRLTADRQFKVDRVVELAEWGVYSNAQLAAITGLRPPLVAELTKKTDATGGRLNPESLDDILEIAQKEARGTPNHKLIAEVLADGTSTRMVSKLTGIAQSTVARRGRKGLAA